ncbi:MAG TPA: hypothetical protein VIJ67_00470 [Pseudolabrys sp.]
MVTITLQPDDLAKLSAATCAEIVTLLGFKSPETAEQSETIWTPVPETLIRKFMSGVAEQSKEILKLLAVSDGDIKWTDLRKDTHYKEWQDLKGFQAGMNRRLRGLLDDPEAIFVGWDDSRTEYDVQNRPIDGYLKIHPETAKSLKSYFGYE